jgi:hypothetical protein
LLAASILFFTLMASASAPATPALDATTAKSLQQFAACFTDRQDRAGRAWAFIPNGNGGTFTDFGARDIATAYRLRVREAEGLNRLRIFLDGSAASLSPIIEAAKGCR